MSLPGQFKADGMHDPSGSFHGDASSKHTGILHRPGTTKSASTKKDTRAAVLTGLPYNTVQQRTQLGRSDWRDKVLYSSRLLLGGNSINGFLRATATAQRIKKQRARQISINKKTAAAAAALAGGTEPPEDKTKDKNKPFDQAEEEKLKKDIMNPRTAKKIKAEMEAGLQFCAQVHNLLRSVVFELDPSQAPYLPNTLHVDEDPMPAEPTAAPLAITPPIIPAPQATGSLACSEPPTGSMPWDVRPKTSGAISSKAPPAVAPTSRARAQVSNKTTASPGNPEGSTLRKLRRKKLPPSNEPPVNLPEFDGSGKRICPKKEHNYRLFELLRYRALRQGDFVAARMTSRDLWILARVLKDYPGTKMAPLEFLQLSETRRESVFRESVSVKDVEEKDGSGSSLVARSLVLPLPRTHSEAAEWGQRVKKGMRVYAMYPQTTSLYPATVLDSTTYCRDDDDIIVVEFDGEEHDATGQVPKFHIPARFVTLIPRGFPASQPLGASMGSKSNKRKGGPMAPGAPKMGRTGDEFLSFDFDGNFDALDLDFDKPLGDEEEDANFPPLI